MLILTFYKGECAYISVPGQEPVEVRFLGQANRRQISIGFKASKRISIDREKIFLRKKADGTI